MFKQANGTPKTSATNETYLFQGRRMVDLSNLSIELRTYHYRNREYLAVLGRFLQRDPIGVWGDEENRGNAFVFEGNAPVNRIDELGLECGVTAHRGLKRYYKEGNKRRKDVGHMWIEYHWNSSSMGFWPPKGFESVLDILNVRGRIEQNDSHQGELSIIWETQRAKGPFSRLKRGQAKGKRCFCVSCEDITDCLRAVAREWGGSRYKLGRRDCRHFVYDVIPKCCLTAGFLPGQPPIIPLPGMTLRGGYLGIGSRRKGMTYWEKLRRKNEEEGERFRRAIGLEWK
jgi:RHS repeat-associated protein